MIYSNGNYIWFLDTLVSIRVSQNDGSDKISILEHHAWQNDSPPMHIHKNEDEIFFVLEGAFRFVIKDKEHQLKSGDVILAPKGIPHSYCIESINGGRWLTITNHGDFESFVKKMGRTAEQIKLPPPSGIPSMEAVEKLTRTAKEFYIEIVGPPINMAEHKNKK
jgi:quercetin dioxygenase-like cupin family protein